jgi:hypothetical protein
MSVAMSVMTSTDWGFASYDSAGDQGRRSKPYAALVASKAILIKNMAR